jgi:hypothetical protein
MAPLLVSQLRDRTHSLGDHPAFPEDDEVHFEEKLMSKRFTDVLKNLKDIMELRKLMYWIYRKVQHLSLKK